MAENATSLVTDEMRAEKGVWKSGRTAPPVSESDIRKWAIAVYWPQTPPRLYWDAEYAKGTRLGGIVAPQDFNPFAWPVERENAGGFNQSATSATAGGRMMNGGQVETFGVPMRPGDVITSRNRLRDWDERETRLGPTIFVYSETEWHNQHDELVKRRVSTLIRY